MAIRYPLVVFAPNGGTTFVIQFSPATASPPLPTPMPEVDPDGRLAAPWRWGGHTIDIASGVVHFRFVNRVNDALWEDQVPFQQM
ncbi:MAG: hypothetical protein JST60_04610 [Chloroflexi bacterium SZAS-1]|nr:hypothetical protein [Chloroflexi bacterium SZAS-1]HNP85774.1 hypothetical protein [Kouleothrix sp.]